MFKIASLFKLKFSTENVPIKNRRVLISLTVCPKIYGDRQGNRAKLILVRMSRKSFVLSLNKIM